MDTKAKAGIATAIRSSEESVLRIERISVEALFGLFYHTINIRTDERITIIHGPNGFGKTVILKMVESLLTQRFSIFRRVPFGKFSIYFNNGEYLTIQKVETERKAPDKDTKHSLLFVHANASSELCRDSLEFAPSSKRVRFPIDYVDRQIHELERIGPEEWMQIRTGKVLDLFDVLEIYKDELPAHMVVNTIKPTPEWLIQLCAPLAVRFIETQRLLAVSERKKNPYSQSKFTYEPSISYYAREIATTIKTSLEQYALNSQQLDSTFPARALRTSIGKTIDTNELTKRLEDLEKQRQKILDAGLLASEHGPQNIITPTTVDDSTSHLLSLYIEDTEQKLAVFSDITKRIELFKELVNKRLHYKQISLDRDAGFQILSKDGSNISPTDLSSGEQHEVVLLYELLFRTQRNALILIDEPEISLHVAWQVEFLKDLTKVIDLSSFDVIVATHSPQIIDNKWELTEELKGPEL